MDAEGERGLERDVAVDVEDVGMVELTHCRAPPATTYDLPVHRGKSYAMATVAAGQLEEIATASLRDRILIAARRGMLGSMAQGPDKVAALLDTVHALDGAGAPHALIGGVAVGILAGVPRATLDTDIAVRSTMDRTAIIAAMQGVGFRLAGEFEHSINFRHATGEPVQLAFDPSFDPMIERAETMDVTGTSVHIVRKGDLIEMKRWAAADSSRRKSKTLRDQADVALLLGDVPDPDEGW